MRIKVINLKKASSFIFKIIILCAIITIFSRIFYNNTKSNASLKLESSDLLSILNKEIIIFRKNDNENIAKKLSNNLSKQTMNNELGFTKMAISQNGIDINENDDSDIEEKNIEANQDEAIDTNIEEAENTIEEPAMRTINRSACFKCSRQIHI